MTQLAISIAILYWLAVLAIAIGIYAVIRTRRKTGSIPGGSETRLAEIEGALASLREQVSDYANQLRQIEVAPAAPAIPGPAMNLTKRSQALRMYRRGDGPEKIAAALSMPQQELDLLLKVHRIVIGEL